MSFAKRLSNGFSAGKLGQRAFSLATSAGKSNGNMIGATSAGDGMIVLRRRNSMNSNRVAAKISYRSESSSSNSDKPNNKSGFAESVEKKFPYTKLTDNHFHQMSQETINDLPLQAFFAGHRPLMLMDPNIGSRKSPEEASRDSDWVTLPASSPVQEADRVLLPLSIINSMGPFDSKNISSHSSRSNTMGESMKNTSLVGYGYSNWRDDESDTTVIFAKTQGNNATIKDVVTLLNDRVDSDFKNNGTYDNAGNYWVDANEIEATSVKRKRRLKMNRHKLKKRRRAQRALKRRLGH